MKPLGVFSINCEDIFSIFLRSNKQTEKYHNIQENILFFQNRLKIYRGKKKKSRVRMFVREVFIEPYTICLDSCCCQCSIVFYSFSRRTGRISHILSSCCASNSKLPTHVSRHLASLFSPSIFLILDEKKNQLQKAWESPRVTPIKCSKGYLCISHPSAQYTET